jgi:hypothetical protein
VHGGADIGANGRMIQHGVSTARKQESSRSWGDVPLPLVLALLTVLVAGFVPFIAITAALPERMPDARLDPASSERAHRAIPRRTVPAYLERALDELGDASARRESARVSVAARAFADAVIEAGGDDPATRVALREAQSERWLARAASGAADGFVLTAERHRAIARGRPLAPRERAIARAWFAFRWEAFGARTSLRAERLPLSTVLAHLLPEDRRALLAWVFSSACHELLGVASQSVHARHAIDRCAAARREFASVARGTLGDYPHAEALAAIDALEGRDLAALARRTADDADRPALQAAAQQAFARAHSQYLDLAASTQDRTLKRYLLGTAQYGP